MSKEKQIEEMAVELAKIYCNPKGCFGCNLCDEYGSLELNCEDYLHYRTTAETLYNAGYAKAERGEWIVDAWDNKKEEWVTIPYNKHLHADAYCSLCKALALLDGAEYGVASNFCPNCGAKMKGGAE